MRLSRRQLLQTAGVFGGTYALGGFGSNGMLLGDEQRRLPRSAPAEQGVASAGIVEFINKLESANLNTHGFMLLRHGHVVAEGWWAPYAPHLRHTLYSLSKSFTSTAVGIAADEGKLKLDAPVLSFFPDLAPAEPSEFQSAMQVKHLLMMGSGHGADALFDSGRKLPDRWTKSALTRPVEHQPGTHFLYNNGASYLLSAIVQKATGQTLFEYLRPRLFEPLAIEGADWEVNPQGVNTGGWGLRVKTEDIARLGLLYLNKGAWNGRRLLSEDWVTMSTSKQIENAPANDEQRRQTSDWAQGYGFQFWRCRHNSVRGDGACGQFCVMIPEQDAVIAINSETNNLQGVLDAVWDHLLPALNGPATPEADGLLWDRLQGLGVVPPQGEDSSPLIGRGERIYSIARNDLGVKQVSLSLLGDSCICRLKDNEGEHSVMAGMGYWITGSTRLKPDALHLVTMGLPDAAKGTPIAASAAWTSENTLEMHWRFTETAHYQRVVIRFKGDGMTFEQTRSAAILNPNNPDPRPVLTGTAV